MRGKRDGWRHGEMATAFFLLAAKLISNPYVKVGLQRSLRSSKKYLIWDPKISVNPSSILPAILAK